MPTRSTEFFERRPGRTERTRFGLNEDECRLILAALQEWAGNHVGAGKPEPSYMSPVKNLILRFERRLR